LIQQQFAVVRFSTKNTTIFQAITEAGDIIRLHSAEKREKCFLIEGEELGFILV